MRGSSEKRFAAGVGMEATYLRKEDTPSVLYPGQFTVRTYHYSMHPSTGTGYGLR